MKAYQLLLGASALALVAQSAAAEVDNPWYFTVRGGLSIAENSHLQGPVTGADLHTDPKKGIAFGAGLGYDFGGVRLEAELRRQENKVKKVYGVDVTPYGLPNGTYNSNGDQNATALMANLYYDINLGGGLKPYIGFGLGAARVNYDSVRAGATTFVDDSKTVFAYQGIAGVRQRLSDAIDLTLDYRYFKTEDPKVVDALGQRLNGDYTDHIVMLGLVWKFGGKTPEPVVPAPAPAPAPAPEPEPEPVAPPPPPPPGPFVVYFDFDKSSIDSESARIIEEAATASNELPSIQIYVRGYTDTSGPNDYNQALSERRAKAVYDELIKRGVPANAMGLEAYGETNLAVETADGVKERLNRRVTIRYGE